MLAQNESLEVVRVKYDTGDEKRLDSVVKMLCLSEENSPVADTDTERRIGFFGS